MLNLKGLVESVSLAASEYEGQARTALDARMSRDEAKRALKEAELTVRYAGTLTGGIDGKNAEQREAQEANLQRLDPSWQSAADLWRKADMEAIRATFDADMSLLNLKIAVIKVNAAMAEAGTTKLLAEVGDLVSIG